MSARRKATMSKRTDINREWLGEAPEPLDRALDRDRDDRLDLLEGADGRTRRGRATEGEARIPLAEERPDVEKRQAQLGEVRLRKAVEAEEQTIPVELAREEVRVEERTVG